MIEFATSKSRDELLGILNLQKKNLSDALTKDEIISQGFVTVNHSYDQLKNLNDIENHIIAKDNGKVIAYLLAMTQQSRSDIPVLVPIFERFEKISFLNKLISDYNYIVVGQVCVDKSYRGKGILDNCYAAYKNQFANKYDFAVTEIASTNLRSLNAHKRVGFLEIDTYHSHNKTEWRIVLWDWRKTS